MPIPVRTLFITPSFAKSILKAKDLKSSLIQNGMISDTIKSLAVLGFAIFAI